MSGDKFRHYFPGIEYNWPSEADYDTLTVDGEKPSQADFDALPWPPVPTLNEAKAAKLAELAALRWEREVGGITFQGVHIKTDERTQATLHAARTWAKEDPNFTVNYKAGDGLFIPANAEMIIAIADLAKLHVQACFNREAALTAQIVGAGSIQALDAIDITTGWPG